MPSSCWCRTEVDWCTLCCCFDLVCVCLYLCAFTGSLATLVKKQWGPMAGDMKLMAHYTRQIAEGLRYLVGILLCLDALSLPALPHYFTLLPLWALCMVQSGHITHLDAYARPSFFACLSIVNSETDFTFTVPVKHLQHEHLYSSSPEGLFSTL